MEDARAQAVAAAQAKSRFLATMSHEIRTPMHGVLGTVELLRETRLSDDQRKYADVIWHSTEALLGIINDILDLSKIEAGKVRIAPVSTSPSHIAQEVVGALAATARGKGLALDLTWSADLPAWVLADPLRLRQVVMNLVGNAVKFTEKGTVTVSLARRAGMLEIAVADTGIGIADDDLHHLFQPFRQVDATTTRRHGGTGLGLSISHQLVELMGGTIQVESRVGEGSIFRVLLPLEDALPPPPAAPAPLPLVSLNGGRILAAEDNPVNQWLLRSQLERLGYQADIHPDGRAALGAFGQGGYVAVVTDYHMPIMDGLDLARAIRAAEGGGPRLPIIGMTADAFAETVEECLRAGMDEVVTKPVPLEELGAVLCRRINGIGPAAAPCAPGPAGLSAAEAPLLDAEILAAVVGDDPACRGEMAALFAATAEDLRTRVRVHMEARDMDELSAAAHSLASAALSLGATRLGLTARAIEHAAQDGDWPNIATLVARLAALDKETRAALERQGRG
ncbi:MAG: ATP-binding protein [Magnetospirillum sp.]|nr:ATP-binding protein [Magnetospirillum sp.]